MPEEFDSNDQTQRYVPISEGTVLSHFTVHSKLGAGGMGEVFLADDTELQRKVALKVLSPLHAADRGGQERLKREALATASLNHPNIVTVYEVGVHQGQLFIAMELVEGESLNKVIQNGVLSFEQALDLVSQIASGLAAAHKSGIVHRDIKPSNVILTPDGRAKILDFGLAKRETDEDLTRDGSTLGTVSFMSPEQVRGEDIDQRSDLFSLGSLFYELITGQRPFPGKGFLDIAQNIAKEPPVPPEQYRGGIPYGIRHILSKCFEKDPALRYQRADEMMADLRRAQREVTGGVAPVAITPREAGDEGQQRLSEADLEAKIPERLPLPARNVVFVLCGVAVACVALLIFLTPPHVQFLDVVEIDPQTAEENAKGLLADLGVSLFGVHSMTDMNFQDDRQKLYWSKEFTQDEQQQLTQWSPLFYYRTLIAGPDHQDVYTIRTDKTGRIYSFHHDTRPDFRPDSISADSARQLAEHLAARLWQLDGRTVSPAPVTETIENNIRQRTYTWRYQGTLPGKATAQARVTLAGAQVIEAWSSAELPPTTVEAFQNRDNVKSFVLMISFGAALVFMIYLMIRYHHSFVYPRSWRWLLMLIPILALQYLNVGDNREVLVIQSLSDNLLNLPAFFVGMVFFSILVYASIMMAYIVLRDREPQRLIGLRRLPSLEFSSRTWSRVGMLGLSWGAILAAVGIYLEAGLRQSGDAARPVYNGLETSLADAFLALIGLPIGTLLLVPFVATVAIGAKHIAKVGKATWPTVLAIMAVFGVPTATNLNPAILATVPWLVISALGIWVFNRYGLFVISVAFISMTYIREGITYLQGTHSVYHQNGVVYLGVWILLLGLSVYGWLTEGRTEESRPSAGTIG